MLGENWEGITAKRRLENLLWALVEVSSKFIYSPFVITEILCPDFLLSRSFLGMSPVPLPSHLTFSRAFPTAYWKSSLGLLRLKSSTPTFVRHLFHFLSPWQWPQYSLRHPASNVQSNDFLLILPIQSATMFGLISFLLNFAPTAPIQI